ncbi:MAG: hypothetical protein KDB82_03245 [Planctomycetes bacterium]|nr:hypothetical protein [Planctomycetota bacterium]
MQKQFLVPALAICGLLVLASVWQLSSSGPKPKPSKPTELASLNEDALEGAPLEATSTAPPSLEETANARGQVTPDGIINKPTQPPPPAPLVENDPEKGRVWVRLLDARSNQPLANTRCRLEAISNNASCFGDWYGRVDGTPAKSRSTDGNGLLSLSVQVMDDDSDEEPNAEVIFHADGWVSNCSIPIPPGWQPTFGMCAYIDGMVELLSAKATTPLDLPVAPAANLHVVVRDRWGVPLPDAELRFALVYKEGGVSDLLALRDDDLEQVDEDGMAYWIDEYRSMAGNTGVSASFNGKPVAEVNYAPGIDDGPVFVSGDQREPVVRNGAATLRGLPCMRVIAAGWHSLYGFGTADLQMVPGSNELNVYLRGAPPGNLKVRVEWHGDGPDEDDELRLVMRNTGPYGECDLLAESEDGHEYEWDIEPAGSGVWQGVINNVPPGYWWLEASARYTTGTAQVRVDAGATSDVVVYIGDDAYAEWTPVIRCNGVPLESASLRLLGGDEERTREYNLYRDTENDKPETVELRAGEYTIWIPTLPVTRISLKPGEQRTDVFDLLTTSVAFSIDSALAALLTPEDKWATLNLLPTGAWDGVEQHLYAMDKKMRERDGEYDVLKPGVTRVWDVPIGSYVWELIGLHERLSGWIEFSSTGPAGVRFSLDNAPGLELLQVERRGFMDGDWANLSFDDDPLTERAMLASADSYDDEYDSVSEYVMNGDYVQQLRGANSISYVFAPRGTMRMEVSSDVGYGSFRVSFPGRITIQPSQLIGPRTAVIRLVQEDEDADADEDDYEEPEFYYYGLVYFEDGSYDEFAPEDEVEWPVGTVTLMASRYKEGADRMHRRAFARVEYQVKPGKHTIDLRTFEYQFYGELDIEIVGHSGSDTHFDSWWLDDGKGPHPVLLALDQCVQGEPRYVSLGEPGRVMPDGKLGLSYRNRLLPPGRYKVIPWAGAPEKYCPTVEVKPGEHARVTAMID